MAAETSEVSDADLAERALNNFKRHFGEDAEDATVEEVKATRGGIEGWALRPEEQVRRIEDTSAPRDVKLKQKGKEISDSKNYNSYLVLGSTFDLEERYEILDPIGQGAYGIVW